MLRIIEVGLSDNPWKKEKNTYGVFINKETFPQGIRLVDKSNFSEEESTTRVEEYPIGNGDVIRVTDFQFPNTLVNFYTESASLNMSARYAKEDRNSMVVVMISTKYQMVQYRTDMDICNTFHYTKEGASEMYYGCAMLTPEDAPNSKEGAIMQLQFKCGEEYRFLMIGGSENPVTTSVIRKPNILNALKITWKKNKEKGRFFMVNDRGIRTRILIVPWDISEDAIGELIESSCYQYNDDEIRVIRLSKQSNSKEISKEDLELIKTEMQTKPKKRAYTSYGMNLPMEVLKELRPMYVFRMDSTGEVRTVKSN